MSVKQLKGMLPGQTNISGTTGGRDVVLSHGRSQENEQPETGRTFYATTLGFGDTAILPGRKKVRILSNPPVCNSASRGAGIYPEWVRSALLPQAREFPL